MSEIDFDDFFEPEEGEAINYCQCKVFKEKNGGFHAESEEDFDFIDPSILKQFQRTSISIEKIQKEIFNFDDKGKKNFFNFYLD